MKFPMRTSAVFLAAMGAALAQPVIRPNSVVNAASYLPAGLPNHGIAQGGMFILKGQGLGTRGAVIANSFPLQTNMGGTAMRITVGLLRNRPHGLCRRGPGGGPGRPF